MRRKEFYWSLFNSAEKNKLDDLRTDQVEAIFAALPKSHHSQWLIWKDGFQNWKPFNEFPKLLEGLRNQKPGSEIQPPPVPTKDIEEIERETEKKLQTELGNLSLVGDKKKGVDRHNRYSEKFKVKVLGPSGQVFKSVTENVSLNGLHLRDSLPDWVTKYFTLELSYANHSISLLCSGVKEKDDQGMHRLRIESNENYNVLRTWLLTAV